MAYVTREQVAQALFDLLVSSSPGVFITSGRRFKMWSDLTASQKPALFMREPDENHQERDAGPEPAVRVWRYDAYIYTAVPDNNVVPSTILNPLIDAIDPSTGGVLVPNPLTGHQTLGGLVYDCRIEGKILKEAGDLTGQGVALIPIRIVVP